MLFLHDVWVNWFEGEENGYNVCHFHEWRKEDTVEPFGSGAAVKGAVSTVSLHRKRFVRAFRKVCLKTYIRNRTFGKIMSGQSLSIVLS